MDTFDQVWDVLASRSQCDERGGAEYERVRAEWDNSDEVTRITAFIMFLANASVETLTKFEEREGGGQ